MRCARWARSNELRSHGGTEIEIAGPSTVANWAEGLPGVTAVRHTGPDTTVVGVAPGVDDQQILHAAIAHGPVRRFTPRTPDLTELFREVVSA